MNFPEIKTTTLNCQSFMMDCNVNYELTKKWLFKRYFIVLLIGIILGMTIGLLIRY